MGIQMEVRNILPKEVSGKLSYRKPNLAGAIKKGKQVKKKNIAKRASQPTTESCLVAIDSMRGEVDQ